MGEGSKHLLEVVVSSESLKSQQTVLPSVLRERDFTIIFSIGLRGKPNISAQTLTVASTWTKQWRYWDTLQFLLSGLILSFIAFGVGDIIAKKAFVKSYNTFVFRYQPTADRFNLKGSAYVPQIGKAG